jgi:hypothetical protein
MHGLLVPETPAAQFMQIVNRFFVIQIVQSCQVINVPQVDLVSFPSSIPSFDSTTGKKSESIE